MKTGKIIFWSLLGITVIGGGAYVYFKYFHTPKPKTKDDFKKVDDGKVVDVSTGETWGKGHDNFPLEVGSFGENVIKLQNKLNSMGESLTVDGRFGEMTKAAYAKYDPSDGMRYPITKSIFDAFVK